MLPPHPLPCSHAHTTRQRRTRGQRANQGTEGKQCPTCIVCEHDPTSSCMQDPICEMACAGGTQKVGQAGVLHAGRRGVVLTPFPLSCKCLQQRKGGTRNLEDAHTPLLCCRRGVCDLDTPPPTLRTLPFAQAGGIGGTAPPPPMSHFCSRRHPSHHVCACMSLPTQATLPPATTSLCNGH